MDRNRPRLRHRTAGIKCQNGFRHASRQVAILFRAIDALKTFDIIFVMTQGGPANASETINILLFNQAFSYFNMGYASSMAVALFALVMGASLILIKLRRSSAW